jgi:universal stress protein E
MKRFKNILFLADRSDRLTVALDRAVDLAQTNGARLTVMDVTADIGLSDYIKRAYSVDLNAQAREQRLQFLETLTQQYTDRGVPVYTTVTTGIPFIEVVRAVQRNAHDLVMKVAEHDSGLASPLFGSTDMHLMRKCPCPVWIDRTGDEPAYHRILAAIDPFDDESGNLQRLILDLAASLADREHATLDVVHAWEMPGESMLANGLKGRPAQIVSGYARDHKSDLIVMGTLGRTGIAGLFIGNTAEDVLRETQTAVLAAKPDGFVSPVE